MAKTNITPVRRIVMARSVARRWLASRAHPEYRVRVFYGARDVRGMPGLLRAFRDGRTKLGEVGAIPDLGVSDDGDSVTIWSADREAMIALAHWFEAQNYETTGVW